MVSVFYTVGVRPIYTEENTRGGMGRGVREAEKQSRAEQREKSQRIIPGEYKEWAEE
jgi:hypothetical protein